jgi:hypothetical protein
MPSLPNIPKIGNIAFAGGTVAVALATGFFMQAGSSDRVEPKRVASLDPNATITSVNAENTAVPAPVVNRDGAPVVDPSVANVPAEPVSGEIMKPNLDLGEVVKKTVIDKANLMESAIAPAEMDERVALAPVENDLGAPLPALKGPVPPVDCQPSLSVEPTAAAMVQLDFKAPCNTGERVTVHHNGMMFTEVTDKSGKLSITAPALAENALFMVSLATGKTLVANTQVTSLDFYDRAVIQWKGNKGLQIHALEFDANYGEDGHVWAENSGSVQQVVSGERGFITHYGDISSPDALYVEVYTFPTLTSKKEGTVRLSVEAEIASHTCGKEIEAQSFQYVSGEKLRVQDMTLQMPDCDSFGGYLVLKNLLEDLTIAHR